MGDWEDYLLVTDVLLRVRHIMVMVLPVTGGRAARSLLSRLELVYRGSGRVFHAMHGESSRDSGTA
jgi:hypothetical protein